MKAWGLQWEHWGDVDDFWFRIFWTRREAMEYAVGEWFSQEEVRKFGVPKLWRRLRYKGVRAVRVKVTRA